MQEEHNKKISEVFAKILQIDAQTITEDTPLATLASWDSFNALMLVAELEKELGMKFTMDEVVNIKTLKDIEGIVKRAK